MSLEEGSRLLADLGKGEADEGYLKGIFDSLAAAVEDGNDAAAGLVESHLEQPYVTSQTLHELSAWKGKSDPVSALEWAADIERRKDGLSGGALLSAAVEGMGLDELSTAEEWARGNSKLPGILELQTAVDGRRRILEDRGDDENEYDKDD